MGSSQSISTEVEIDAPPATVRSVFMDFPRYNEWSKWVITPSSTNKPTTNLSKDDKLKVNLGGMAFSPTIVSNSSDSFVWLGSLPFIFTGQHEFIFSPSTKNPGGTRFIQLENFTGLLAFLLAPGWSFRKSTVKNWEGFNAELKKECEKARS